jgi:hypothetical protein
MATMKTEINGVPREQWGVWCPHGKHIVIADPADDSDYPLDVAADPWPCTQGCTWEGYQAERAEEAAKADAEQWADYYRMIG